MKMRKNTAKNARLNTRKVHKETLGEPCETFVFLAAEHVLQTAHQIS